MAVNELLFTIYITYVFHVSTLTCRTYPTVWVTFLAMNTATIPAHPNPRTIFVIATPWTPIECRHFLSSHFKIVKTTHKPSNTIYLQYNMSALLYNRKFNKEG